MYSACFFLAASSFFIEGSMAIHDALVARQEISSTPSATSSGSSSTPSSSTIPLAPFLYFQPVPQAFTCQPLEFSWFYNGPDNLFTFYATNVGVLQSGAPPPLTLSGSTPHPSNTFTDNLLAVPSANPPLIITTTVALATNVPGSKLDLIWSAVTVPQGWYVINATMQSSPYTVLTSAFYVHTSGDTSCILVTPSSTASSGSTSVPVPVGGSSMGGANTGTIIGASVGAVAFVAALFALFLFFLHRRRKRSLVSSGGMPHRWNGLGSTDAGLTSGGKPHSYRNQPHRADSMATIQMTPSEEAVAAEKYSTTGKFDDDTNSNGHDVALAYLPVLSQHPYAKAMPLGRTYSTSSSVSAHGAQHVYPSTPANLKRTSIVDSVHARQSVDSTTYPPTSPTRQSTLANSKSTAPAISLQGDNNDTNNSSTTSPIDAATKLTNRNSLGRKRKPVPAYDPNQNPSPPVSPQAALPIPSSSPYSTNSSPSPDPSVVGHGQGSVGGHYATRSQLGQDHSVPDLTHKSSFGPGGVEGKPLHYLIPDMPMPSKR